MREKNIMVQVKVMGLPFNVLPNKTCSVLSDNIVIKDVKKNTSTTLRARATYWSSKVSPSK